MSKNPKEKPKPKRIISDEAIKKPTDNQIKRGGKLLEATSLPGETAKTRP